MSIKEALQIIVNTGYPTATFAKRINRDSSTLYKWLDGSRQISKEVEAEVAKRIRELKKIYEEIEI